MNKHEFTDQKRGVDSELRECKDSVRETKRPPSLGAKSNVMRASFKCIWKSDELAREAWADG